MLVLWPKCSFVWQAVLIGGLRSRAGLRSGAGFVAFFFVISRWVVKFYGLGETLLDGIPIGS